MMLCIVISLLILSVGEIPLIKSSLTDIPNVDTTFHNKLELTASEREIFASNYHTTELALHNAVSRFGYTTTPELSQDYITGVAIFPACCLAIAILILIIATVYMCVMLCKFCCCRNYRCRRCTKCCPGRCIACKDNPYYSYVDPIAWFLFVSTFVLGIVFLTLGSANLIIHIQQTSPKAIQTVDHTQTWIIETNSLLQTFYELQKTTNLYLEQQIQRLENNVTDQCIALSTDLTHIVPFYEVQISNRVYPCIPCLALSQRLINEAYPALVDDISIPLKTVSAQALHRIEQIGNNTDDLFPSLLDQVQTIQDNVLNLKLSDTIERYNRQSTFYVNNAVVPFVVIMLVFNALFLVLILLFLWKREYWKKVFGCSKIVVTIMAIILWILLGVFLLLTLVLGDGCIMVDQKTIHLNEVSFFSSSSSTENNYPLSILNSCISNQLPMNLIGNVSNINVTDIYQFPTTIENYNISRFQYSVEHIVESIYNLTLETTFDASLYPGYNDTLQLNAILQSWKQNVSLLHSHMELTLNLIEHNVNDFLSLINLILILDTHFQTVRDSTSCHFLVADVEVVKNHVCNSLASDFTAFCFGAFVLGICLLILVLY